MQQQTKLVASRVAEIILSEPTPNPQVLNSRCKTTRATQNETKKVIYAKHKSTISITFRTQARLAHCVTALYTKMLLPML